MQKSLFFGYNLVEITSNVESLTAIRRPREQVYDFFRRKVAKKTHHGKLKRPKTSECERQRFVKLF